MIKNIIFDFGDIFINLDKPATAKEMIPYGFKEMTPELQSIFDEYEKGMFTSNEFLNQVNQIFPKATKENLTTAWNAILLDFPDHRLEFLENLAAIEKHRIFLLSNTNEIHIDWVKESMGTKFDRFISCFEVPYLSYEMKMRKPDSEIYEFVLDENNLNPTETLFIDDTKENTDSAASLGIKVWNLLVGKEDIIDLDSKQLW